MTTYPIAYQRPGHGNLIANNETEARQWESLGWEAVSNEPATYELYPILLYGPPDSDLPPVTVNSAAEAKAAAGCGYVLPSDEDLADGEEAYTEVLPDDAYDPQEFPKMLAHPDHRPAVPQGFDWSSWTPMGGSPRPISAVPEAFPPMTVSSPQEEQAARARGWNLPEMGQKRKLSGAQRRKLARQAAAQEIAPS